MAYMPTLAAKGLVIQPEYRWFSSARYWLYGGQTASDVVLSPLFW